MFVVVRLLYVWSVVTASALSALWLQTPEPPHPPKPPGRDAAQHIQEVYRKLNSTRSSNPMTQKALDYGRELLGNAEEAIRAGKRFKADRLAEAADSLVRVAEHQQHLAERARARTPPPPPPDLSDHLARVYFRTKQSDYFLRQSNDPRAAELPRWARSLYQAAMRDYERKDFVGADENAKASEEVVKALENIAQAAMPLPVARPPGAPQPPPPPPPRPRDRKLL